MLNFLYDDPEDYWQGHAPYNCAVQNRRADFYETAKGPEAIRLPVFLKLNIALWERIL